MILRMKKSPLIALLFSCTLCLHAQTATKADPLPERQTVQKVLGFEVEEGGGLPTGWHGGPAATIAADNKIAHSGQWSARLERKPDSEGTFSTLTKSLPMDFAGTEIELRGFLRLQDVSDFVGLWMREDADGNSVVFTNMQDQKVHGTRDWAEYSIKLPVNSHADRLVFGVLASGTGTAWADDLQLLVDGKPIADAPAAPPKPRTVLDTDHEFDTGSRIAMDHLTPIQIENLATLGRVWGFLKYHHPQVTSGQRHWDYELFRVMPRMLAATDRAQANAALVQWIDGLGQVPDCKPCAHVTLDNLDIKPDLDWIHHQEVLGKPLSERLEHIYENRVESQQFYVSLVKYTGNPSFDHELTYSAVKFPDPGYQILALYRLWNIMQYWAPYREVAGQNWPQVLSEFIPKVALAKDKDAYQLAMMELIARANDTHANLWSSLQVRPPVGECALPIDMRFIDDQPVVTGYSTKEAESASEFKAGDIVNELDGVAVTKLVATWTPLYADSNQAARLRDMAQGLTRGKCGAASVQVRRGNEMVQLSANRVHVAATAGHGTHDLPGDTFRLLSKDVAYVKLSTIKAVDVPHYIDLAKETKGLIVDIRNYPSDFMPFVLGSLLVTGHTPFVTFTQCDLSNPGAFRFADPLAIDPALPHYGGKVVILVDEVSQSQAEYTAMALRSAPNAVVVGSTTAGADGNVSTIPLPGDLRGLISGLGVYYPDKRPTQRVGIKADIEVKPTVAGVKAGRDEVLEQGIRQIVGADAPRAEVERLAKE